MKTEQDRLNRLIKSRVPVQIARLKKGDYVYDGLCEKWMTVIRLVRCEGIIKIEGENPSGEIVQQDSSVCFPSWNPRHKIFGRQNGETRAKYWLP